MATGTFYLTNQTAQDVEFASMAMSGEVVFSTDQEGFAVGQNFSAKQGYEANERISINKNRLSEILATSGLPASEDDSFEDIVANSFSIAIRAFQNNDIEQAEMIAREIVRAAPTHIFGIHLLGVIAMNRLDWGGAEIFFKGVLLIDAQNVEALGNLGLISMNQGKLDAAEKSFLEALEIEPKHVTSICNLSETEYLKGHAKAAYQTAFKATKINPESELAQLQAARMARAADDLETSIAHLKVAVALMPEDTAPFISLIGTYLDMGDFQAACSYALVSVETFSGHVDSKTLSNFWRLAGIAKLNLHDREMAQTYLEKSLVYNPEDERAAYFLAAARDESPQQAPASYVSALFDANAQTFDAHLKDSLDYKTPSLISSLLSGTFETVPQDSRLLDLGCGTGLMAEALLDRDDSRWSHTHLYGVDLSENMLLQAAVKGLYGDLRLMDATSYLETPLMGLPETWHFVLAADLSPYIGNLLPLFSAVTSRLSSGGHFVLSLESHEGDKEWTLQETGRFSHCPDAIMSLAQSVGLSLIKQELCILRQNGNAAVHGALLMFSRS